MKKVLLPLAGLALIAGPVAAQSLPAIAPISGQNELGGENEGSAPVIAAALIAGVVAIAVFAFTDDDDDSVSA